MPPAPSPAPWRPGVRTCDGSPTPTARHDRQTPTQQAVPPRRRPPTGRSRRTTVRPRRPPRSRPRGSLEVDGGARAGAADPEPSSTAEEAWSLTSRAEVATARGKYARMTSTGVVLGLDGGVDNRHPSPADHTRHTVTGRVVPQPCRSASRRPTLPRPWACGPTRVGDGGVGCGGL